MIKQLQQINLTAREAEVYFALLQKKEFSAPELTKITNVTRTKIYEILQNLINKGACTESYKDGQKIFQGIEPKIALQNIISNFELEFNQKKQAMLEQMNRATNLLEKELANIYSNNKHKIDTIDYIEILSNRNQIKDRWFNLQQNAQHEIITFTKPPYVSPWGENASVLENAISKKKVHVKSIYESCGHMSSAELQTEFIDSMASYENIGEEIRILDRLPMKLSIIDEKFTLLALNDLVVMNPSITTIIITHTDFAMAHKEVFKSYWEKSIPLENFKKNRI
jgi:HTH-type transcriptional regulator, sugar sensing transcriptional regulator